MGIWTTTATATQEEVKKPEKTKKIVNYYISKNTLSRFKQVCDNQQQTYSKVIENYMTRHCNK
jgi:hypothetical protein